MSFMLLSHVIASLCLYISSKAMYSYIPNPCGTPSVFFAIFFQVVSPQLILFQSGSSQCGAEGPIRRPERGGEWEPIKILLKGDWNSDKMNSLGRTPKITLSALLPSVCRNHVATRVLLVLGTNSTSNLNTHASTTAETAWKPANQRGRLDRV
jgi:hypothetical protein